MNGVSDYLKNSADSEIDEILAQVKKTNSSEKTEQDAPSKSWSLDDIDRLIAQANGEEYVPPVEKKAPTPAEDFERILSREFDTGIFTLRPMEEVEPKTVMQDISSMSSEVEVDGQETFFDGEEDDFDESLFEIETVIVPEDAPKPMSTLFAWQEKPVRQDPGGKTEEVKISFEEDTDIMDFFERNEGKKVEEKPETKPEIKAVTKPEEKPEVKSEKEKIVDYKTRFFTTLKLENTMEIEVLPDGPVDRSGIVVRKSDLQAESGLEAMPRVLTAEDAMELDAEKTRIMEAVGDAEKKIPNAGSDVEGQIMLTGFEEIPSETLPEQSHEIDVEEQLSEMRKQKAKNFRLINAIDLDEDFQGDFEAPPEERARQEKKKRKTEKKQVQTAAKAVAKEYTVPSERAAMHTLLSERNRKATKGLIVVGVIELLIILFNLIPVIAESLAIETTAFIKGSAAMCVINAVLIIAAVAIDNVRFVDGITGIFKKNITGDTAVSLTLAIALVQNTLAAVIGGDEIATTVFSAAAVGAVLISKLTEKINAQRTLSNFEVCTFKYEHNMYAVHPIENESEIFELGRGLMMGNAELLYSSKVEFPQDFMKNSEADASDKKLVGILVPAALGAAAVAAIAAGIIDKSVMAAFSAFTGTFCVCSPVFASVIPAFIALIANRELNATGTMISGLEAAQDTASANAVVMDCADIFDRSKCTMHGMKDFKSIRIDDVLLYAAALVIKSGGPLRESFEQVVDGRQDLLPAVKELAYEDKLGITARIHGQKVLLGNRNLLVNHSIDVPEKSLEERYSHGGRKVMYLAVAGKLAAMFVVSYTVDKNLAPYFKMLESNGIQVLVRTNDVNVTEELISKSFGLPRETFKILSSVAGKLFKRRRDAVCDKLPAKIVHDGTAFSMLRAVSAACSMNAQMKLGSIMQIVIAALGFVLSMVLYCTANGAVFNGITAALFMLFSVVISVVMIILRKIK